MSGTDIGSIWVVANTKGGVGKSTTTVNVAVELSHKGFSVCIINSDPNTVKNPEKPTGSAGWHAKRIKSMEKFDLPNIDIKSTHGDIFDMAQLMSHRYNYVIVDTAGIASTEFSSAAATAHLIIVPTDADVYDADTEQMGFSTSEIPEMNDSIKRILSSNRRCKSVSVINKAPTRSGSVQRKETLKYLRKFEYLQPLKTSLSFYEKIFGESTSLGLGVVETDHTKAKAQIQLITDELIAIDNS